MPETKHNKILPVKQDTRTKYKTKALPVGEAQGMRAVSSVRGTNYLLETSFRIGIGNAIKVFELCIIYYTKQTRRNRKYSTYGAYCCGVAVWPGWQSRSGVPLWSA